MKKRRNFVGYAAAVLLYSVLFTTYLLSVIFARFTVSSSGADMTRTAKYGVAVTTQGSILQSGATLLPGMVRDEGLIISVSGKPEVAMEICADLTGQDLCLPAGYYHVDYGENTIQYLSESEHDDRTGTDPDHYRFCFHVEEDYHPLRFSVYQKSAADSDWMAVAGQESVTADALAIWLADNIGSVSPANSDLTERGQWKIMCSWPQGSGTDEASAQTYKDTLLLSSINIAWINDRQELISAPAGFVNQETLELIVQINQVD